MNTKQFVEKAIEGGWNYKNRSKTTVYDMVYDHERPAFEEILLDPLAWQAVGKVEGWDIIQYKKRIGTTSTSFQTKLIKVNRKASVKKGSFSRMHRMVDALCEGKRIIDFLETL